MLNIDDKLVQNSNLINYGLINRWVTFAELPTKSYFVSLFAKSYILGQLRKSLSALSLFCHSFQ